MTFLAVFAVGKDENRNGIRSVVRNAFAVFDFDNLSENRAVKVNNRVNIIAFSAESNACRAAEGVTHAADFICVGHREDVEYSVAVLAVPGCAECAAFLSRFNRVKDKVASAILSSIQLFVPS